MRKSSILILLVLIAALAAILLSVNPRTPVVEEIPTPIPVTPVISPATKDDMIVLYSPLPKSAIASPLTIEGKARGNWFFEASFPIVLTNWDGVIIAEGFATAQGEWMTTEYVPFTATLAFTKPDTQVSDRGWLILKKDNPSGEPQFDNALEVEIHYQ